MSETALLVVDVQVAAMEEPVGSEPVIANVERLVSDARDAGVPVVWVQHEAAGLTRCSDEWQIVPQLKPASGEPIVHKRWGDAFVETDLVERLSDVGAKHIVLCGTQTDVCIRSTFYGGIYRGYDVTLVEDAHDGRHARARPALRPCRSHPHPQRSSGLDEAARRCGLHHDYR